MNIKEWGDIIGTPSVGLLVGVIGYWAKRELKNISDRVGNMESAVSTKMESALCTERRDGIEGKLVNEEGTLKQILASMEEMKAIVRYQHLQQQESTRIIGECLVVLCQDLGGNGMCSKVQTLLDKLSDERFNIAQ